MPLGLLLGYVAVSVAWTWSVWTHPASREASLPGDSAGFTWWIQNTAWSLAHAHSPLVTHNVLAPMGANAMWNTSVVALGIVLSPITYLAGAVVAYNVAVVGSISLSAWTAALLAHRWVHSWAACAVAGAVFGFGPFLAAQSFGHLHLMAAFLIPVLVLLIDEAVVRRRWAPWRTGLLLSVTVTAQLLLSEELLSTAVLMAVVLLVVLAVAHRDQVPAAVRYLSRMGRTFLPVTALLCAYPLAVQFFGPDRVTGGSFQPSEVYSNDLLSFVLPTEIQQFVPSGASTLTQRFSANPIETSGYLGLPLLLLLAVAVVRWWRHRPEILIIASTGLVAALLSLGSRVRIDGQLVAQHLRLPGTVLAHLPVLHNLEAARFMVYGDLAAALLVAVVVGRAVELARAGSVLRPAVLATAGLVAVVPLTPSISHPLAQVSTPPFFRTAAVRQSLVQGQTALVLPLSVHDSYDALLWQAASRNWFAMPEGYISSVDARGHPTVGPPVTAFYDFLLRVQNEVPAPSLSPAIRPAALAQLQRDRVTAVVLGPCRARAALLADMTALLARPPENVAGVSVWRISPG